MQKFYTLLFFVLMAATVAGQECPPFNPTPMVNNDFTISVLGTYATGVFDESAAEIADYHAPTQRVIFSNSEENTVIILDASDPTNPTLVTEIAAFVGTGGINSVSFFDSEGGSFAAVYEGEMTDSPGTLVGYAPNGAVNLSLPAGVLPDMVNTNTNLGVTGIAAISANEGEPDDDYQIDPVGSITVATVSSSTTYDFSEFNDQQDALIAAGVRLYGPGATVAQDMEPEYVVVSNDTAYVICQENNAFARFDLMTRQWIDIIPFGFKDHSCAANAFDPSNDDDGINLATYNVLGMFQPDAVAGYQVNGATYLVTANEGDSRDYDGYSEEARVADVTLDPTAYPDAATLQDDAVLGRLNITTALGDIDGDGDFDQLYSYGARSFSIFSSDGTLIWDSGSEFERILAELLPDNFNSTNDDNDSFDNRSDDKGPEPEAVAIGTIMERTYAFIGLERIGGIMVYDITDPAAPFFVTYANNRNFDVDAQLPDGSSNPAAGDLGVEDITFVSAEDSPNGSPMLITANEVSGTVTFFGLGGDLVSVRENVAAEVNLEVFPNPSQGDLNLNYSLSSYGEVSVAVFDLHGRQLSQQMLGMRNAGNHQEKLFVDQLTPGTYLLHCYTPDGIATTKLIRM